MKVLNFILILLNALTLSVQYVHAGFFCDDYLTKLTLINGATDFIIGTISNIEKKEWKDYYSYELNADPGDLVKINCYNKEGPAFGGGCFLINNYCRCYNFNIDGKNLNKNNAFHSGRLIFNNNRKCDYKAIWLQQEEIGDHEYYYYIPLDVDAIRCIHKTITASTDIEHTLKFSDFIDPSFNIKNLKISIEENNQFFTLNNEPLSPDDKFYISSKLKYISEQSSLINIKFKNYGIVLENNKICDFNIRFCYNSCEECNDIESNETSHQCLKCKDGFYFIENTNNCISKNEKKDPHYYFDDNETIFKHCLNPCSTCDNETYCTKCVEG